MSGKRAFLELLKQEGVDMVFGNPGTTELPLMDAFAVEHDIKYVLGLQEAALMAMADGFAQASGRLAVLNFHVAPGLGNAMGMLYDAQKAGSPILLTAGQQDQDYIVTEPILSADLPTLARPFVKWAAEVHRVADLPRLVHRAVKTALAPPTGPVFLSLPGDILKHEGDLDLMTPTRIAPRLRGDAAAIHVLDRLLGRPPRVRGLQKRTASDLGDPRGRRRVRHPRHAGRPGRAAQCASTRHRSHPRHRTPPHFCAADCATARLPSLVDLLKWRGYTLACG